MLELLGATVLHLFERLDPHDKALQTYIGISENRVDGLDLVHACCVDERFDLIAGCILQHVHQLPVVMPHFLYNEGLIRDNKEIL